MLKYKREYKDSYEPVKLVPLFIKNLIYESLILNCKGMSFLKAFLKDCYFRFLEN